MRAPFFARMLYVLTVLFVSLGTVQAGTIFVDDDNVTGYRALGPAVQAARSGDTIVVAPGTYIAPTSCDIILAGKILTITGTNPRDPDVVAATVIDCFVDAAVQEKLDAQGTKDIDGHRFITLVPDTGVELTLAGLTIINGSGAFSGGAVYCEGATLDVANCVFAQNNAQQWGGAVHCREAIATFTNCSFNRNVSTAKRGGAVFCEDSDATFEQCSFTQNTGNAVRNRNSNTALYGCTFMANTAQNGGAIYCWTVNNPPEAAEMILDHCTFSNNTCQISGGAIYIQDALPTITGCTFTNNLANDDGGAIYNYRATPVITSSLFIANTAVGTGGAIANYLECHPDIISSTFVGNKAAEGGAVSSARDCHPFLSHCILWNNTAAKGTNLYLVQDPFSRRPSEMTVAYSDLKSGPASAHAEPGTTLTWGQGNINADPLFTQPAKAIYRLSADSPCVDAGHPDHVPSPGAVDLDGHRRLFGRTVDMGAYEYQGVSPVYRFWSAVKSRHFYTILGAERDKLIKQYPGIWQYEAVAYWACYGPSERNLAPVHRFWSPTLEAHIWTISEDEKNRILRDYSDIYQYEGVVYYAFPAGGQPLGTVPVYRFWSSQLGHHFYTISEDEKDKLLTNYSKTWIYEGIVWYVYPRPYQLQQATYDFAAGPDAATYSMTLSAYVDGKEVPIDLPEVRLTPNVTEMQMGIDFANRSATLDNLEIRTQMADHSATIDAGGAHIPFTISVQGAFEALSPQGPFAVDPTTGIFADFSRESLWLDVRDATFSYNGRVAFSNRELNINATAEAQNLELASYGSFDSLSQLPNNITAYMPQTFQWHRARTEDLLVQTEVKGYLVQLYVTSMYVGTEDLWTTRPGN